MKKSRELRILYPIALGVEDIDAVASESLLKKEQVRQIIDQFSKEGLIRTQNGLSLSKKGLLELSRWIASLESKGHRYAFWSANGLPYFPYQNEFSKDVISHPQLFFNPARPSVDEEKRLVYKTLIPNRDFTWEDLEIIYNLLYESRYLHPTGFWLLRCEEERLCGWGVSNLRRSLQLVRKPISFKFVCAFNDFIFLIHSDIVGSEFAKLKSDIYLTREISPYIDTMDLLSDRLKIFLNFYGVEKLPRGTELQMKHANEWEGLPEPRLRFVPEVCGRISYSNENLQLKSVPFVVVMTPSHTKTVLRRVSPWFVTCPGGCLEESLAAKKTHRVHLFQVLSFPEIDIVTLMIRV